MITALVLQICFTWIIYLWQTSSCGRCWNPGWPGVHSCAAFPFPRWKCCLVYVSGRQIQSFWLLLPVLLHLATGPGRKSHLKEQKDDFTCQWRIKNLSSSLQELYFGMIYESTPHLLSSPQPWRCGRGPAVWRRRGPLGSPASPPPPGRGHGTWSVGRPARWRRSPPSLCAVEGKIGGGQKEADEDMSAKLM